LHIDPENMETALTLITELLKTAIPAGIIGWVALRIADRHLDSRNRQLVTDMRAKGRQETLTLRLQACERLLLFMERSEPSGLIMRLHRPGMGANLLRSEMLRSLRDEFDHNLTQQLYVSPATWARVREARDAVQQIVQTASDRMGDTSTGTDLANTVLAIVGKAGISPTAAAVEAIRDEAQGLM
jgi:hypothetical protein